MTTFNGSAYTGLTIASFNPSPVHSDVLDFNFSCITAEVGPNDIA